MPYPNEHSARLQDPKRFNPKNFRRTEGGTIYGRIRVPKTIGIIWGKLKGKDKPSDNPIPQALRFPVKYWTVEKAKKWLKDNNVKYQKFEPAQKEKSESSFNQVQSKGKYTCECIKCGHTIETNKHCNDIKCPKCGGQMRRKERPGPGRNQSDMANHNIFALIAQLETQFWVMEPRALQGLFSNLARREMYLPDDIQITVKDKIKDLLVENSIAIIDIKGVLMREVPRAFEIWGIEATSYNDIIRQVMQAINEEKVESILLRVNSPGGTVPGVMETADLIRAARDKKPVNAVVADIGASGAYWLASQAHHIESEANGHVGSIGVFTVYVDMSKRADELGIKVHVIRSGEHKGMGIPGAEITETQIAAIQEIIDGVNKNFIDAVAKGRQREKKEIRELATGRSWLADKAVQLGLIDGILENQLLTNVSQGKEKVMDEQEKIDAQAELNQLSETVQGEERKRLAELRAAFPDDLDFAIEAFEKGSTVQEAKAERFDLLQQEKIAEQNAGAKPIASGDSDSEQEGDFLEEAHKLLDDGKAKNMVEAMRKIRRRQPELHEAYKEKSRAEGRAIYNW